MPKAFFWTLNGQILSQFHNFRSGHIYQISSKNTFRHANKEIENYKKDNKDFNTFKSNNNKKVIRNCSTDSKYSSRIITIIVVAFSSMWNRIINTIVVVVALAQHTPKTG